MKRKLLSNIFYLLIVQVGNYIVPFITFPYLVRNLGIEKFGTIAFFTSFMQYFVIITDYGFNLTATRTVSIDREDKEKISSIYSAVLAIKAALLLLCLIIIYAIVFTVPKFRNEWRLVTILLVMVLGNLLYPVWLFQGLEKMKLIAYINLTSKLISTVLIFIFIKTESDYLNAAAIQCMSIVICSFLSLVYLSKILNIRIKKPSLCLIKKMFHDGMAVFASVFSSTLFNNTNIFVLGLFTSDVDVGKYAVAEKIVKAFILLSAPVSTGIFPHVSKLFNESRESAVVFLQKVAKYGSILFISISIILFTFSDLLVKIVNGHQEETISILVKIMSLLPLTIFVDNIYGTQVLINLKKHKEFLKAIMIPGIVSILLSFFFVPKWGSYATAVIFLVSEISVLILMIEYVRKNKITIMGMFI